MRLLEVPFFLSFWKYICIDIYVRIYISNRSSTSGEAMRLLEVALLTSGEAMRLL